MVDVDRAAKIIELPDETTNGLSLVAVIEMERAEVAVLRAVAKHVIAGGEHGCGDGQDRLLGSAARLDAEKLGFEVAVLLPHGGPGGGHQRGLEPVAALSDTGGATLPGALVVSRTKAGPGDQVSGAGEARHVDADLRHDDLGDDVTDSGIVVSKAARSWIGASTFPAARSS